MINFRYILRFEILDDESDRLTYCREFLATHLDEIKANFQRSESWDRSFDKIAALNDEPLPVRHYVTYIVERQFHQMRSVEALCTLIHAYGMWLSVLPCLELVESHLCNTD